MCSHYEALQLELFVEHFNAAPPPTWGDGELDMWPRYGGAFVRISTATGSDAPGPAREALVGRWGLVPSEMKPAKKVDQMKLSTFNARDDRVEKSFTFRGAWHKGQHCIVPVAAFYEPDWRSGKAIPTRFTRADGKPMGVAGLWDAWTDPADGQQQLSFTMLTIDATQHPLLKHYHQLGKEKRMIVVLPENRFEAWLAARPEESRAFLQQYPADGLLAKPRPKLPKSTVTPAPETDSLL